MASPGLFHLPERKLPRRHHGSPRPRLQGLAHRGLSPTAVRKLALHPAFDAAL